MKRKMTAKLRKFKKTKYLAVSFQCMTKFTTKKKKDKKQTNKKQNTTITDSIR